MYNCFVIYVSTQIPYNQNIKTILPTILKDNCEIIFLSVLNKSLFVKDNDTSQSKGVLQDPELSGTLVESLYLSKYRSTDIESPSSLQKSVFPQDQWHGT